MHSDCKRKSILWVPKLPPFEFAEVTYFQHNDGKRGFGACVPQEPVPIDSREQTTSRGGGWLCLWRSAHFLLCNSSYTSFNSGALLTARLSPSDVASSFSASNNRTYNSEANLAANFQPILAPLNLPHHNFKRLVWF